VLGGVALATEGAAEQTIEAATALGEVLPEALRLQDAELGEHVVVGGP
jgi:hypothetical protein